MEASHQALRRQRGVALDAGRCDVAKACSGNREAKEKIKRAPTEADAARNATKYTTFNLMVTVSPRPSPVPPWNRRSPVLRGRGAIYDSAHPLRHLVEMREVNREGDDEQSAFECVHHLTRRF